MRRSVLGFIAACLFLVWAPALAQDNQHDFDFEFGSWHAHLQRLMQPLSGSRQWTQYDGTSVVRKVWNGKADLGEFDVQGPAGRIHGLSLRLYNPQTAQWSIYWANAKNGSLTTPLVGAFHNGRGEFMDHDTYNGRPILARFIITLSSRDKFSLVQSFSPDNGKTWEANWIATFIRDSAKPE